MIRIPLILACLMAPAIAPAQDAPTTDPAALDLSVPQEPIRYLGDPAYQADPPGTFYGDHSGRRLTDAEDARATVVDDKLQVHGSVSTGIGYSKRYGNSHWSAASINLGKNYTNDEGETRRVDVNIDVSQGKGPGYFGPGPGYRGPVPPYGW
ncbi:hypothetical protein OK348_12805 [Flavobacterium sp. MXW15]|uniref:Adhesin n=1 Tax=Xanthomonas chitinilytica TaxID=2989819 RepID=A0ABT3JXA4_9XANT|nr:hypothetical protein [Xanthomonas sp. H13-6]MCW4455665.1 hypothetical protein [Flavobacterium sp. MXW15]MCW4472849.1 hypothetical protein [Xanthomonas sp. H13-6]